MDDEMTPREFAELTPREWLFFDSGQEAIRALARHAAGETWTWRFAHFAAQVEIVATLRDAQDFRDQLSVVTCEAVGLGGAISRTLLGRVRWIIKQRDTLAVAAMFPEAPE